MLRLILLVFIVKVSEAQEYEIARKAYDEFTLPTFLCTSSWESECTKMGGEKTVKKCICKCTRDNKNVFGYFDNSWKCASNHDVRNKYSGCSKVVLLRRKTSNSSLKVVIVQRQTTRKLGRFQRECVTLESEISYLGCNGTWIRLKQDSDRSFHFGAEADSDEQLQFLFSFDRSDFDRYTPKIYGHVIKLIMSCNDNAQILQRYCVLLKVQGGKQRCSVSLPTTTPPTRSTTSTTITQSASSTSSSSKVSTTASSTSSNEKTTQVSTTTQKLTTTLPYESTISTNPIIDISSTIRSVSEIKVGTSTSDAITNSRQKGTNADDSSSSIIAGAVGGIAALVVIVVMLFVILKRRRRHLQARKRESVAPLADNPPYRNATPINEQLEFPDDDEYSYAYTNNHPIVIKDRNGKAVTDSNVANGHNRNINGVLGSPPNQQAPVYSTLEDPNCAKLQKSANTSNGPSYNTLERPENQWTTKQGPVYDVLQDPNTLQNKDGPIYNTLKDPNEPSYNTLERPENNWMTKQGPVYDVLEDPNSTGGPVYSVLEGPNSNDQQVYDDLEGQDPNVYGSLDSPDPHVYGALYSPTSKSAPAAYDNDIYDSAGGTIIDEDTYQELNQTDQRSSDIYQPVRPPRNTMAMKNMSGITQSQA